MTFYPLHNYFVFNQEIRPIHLFVPAETEGGIYEVLRVSQSVPLFLEDHLNRFFHSANIAGKNILFSTQQIETLLNELIQKNEVAEGNILLSCNINLTACFIPHVYPSGEQYETGVKCGLLNAERDNPNAKVLQTTVRMQADKMLEENGFYEVLLVNQFNCITEGSRSNIFFWDGNKIITPPARKVLLGITRSKVIQLASDMGVTVSEEDVALEKLTSFRSAFLTGTSPKILPVKQVDKVSFDPQNQTVRILMKKYDDLMVRYINRKRT